MTNHDFLIDPLPVKDCKRLYGQFTILKTLDMHKRLLLLGVISIGWIPGTQAYDAVKGSKTKTSTHHSTHHSTTGKYGSKAAGDTHAISGISNNAVSIADSQVDFQDLFIATSMGSSNGVKLNPRALSFVQDYMEKNWTDLQSMKNWGRPYFNLIDGILNQYGLPRELKYLAVIESQLKPTAVSWVGAVGPWQLMPQTARDLGLKVSRRSDERKNYYKSTHAAALYLRDLYNELGDWLLVIAAYNGGTNNVYRAIKKSGSRNFWDLQYYLPLETRLHVKKFIGTQYTFEGQGSVTTLTRQEATEQLTGSSMYVFTRKISAEEPVNAKTVSVSGKYCSAAIAHVIL